MLLKRNKEDRGQTKLSWLDGKHSFSFGEFYDPQFTQFSSLRVMNEDHIAGGGGFGTHPHRDMEIITYVMSGQLEHKDSEGNVGIIEPGEVQRMSAGTGIFHSEYNHSQDDEVHLYQIWLTPHTTGIKPGYEQQRIPVQEKPNQLHIIASPDGRNKSLHINEDTILYAGKYTHAQSYQLPVETGRQAWLQVVQGSLLVNDVQLDAGDGLAVSEESTLHVSSEDEHEILYFDLP